ncbi:MAG TPA: cytochrome P450 [Gemmatimonadota bacterium]|nr:cytochrome P450 [Gemmatimonadota bacterium]
MDSTPPGPPGHFLLGHLPEFARDTLGFVEAAARGYGDIVRFRLAGRTAYLLNDLDAIEHVLVTDHRNFIKHTFFWRHVRAIFGAGLLTNEGDFWLRQRRLIQPAFHHERIAGYGRIMVEYTERRLARWRDGDTFDVRAEMNSLTFEIVARSLFDAEVAAEVEEIGEAFNTGIEQIAARFRRPYRIPDRVPTPGNRRYRRAVARMDALIYRIIAEHRDRGAGGDDLLSVLMRVRDDEDRPMSEEQLRDETITMLLAGHETTALALTWTWWLLSQHPAAAGRLEVELDAVLAGRPPRVEDLPRLAWTEAVVKESLRLYPPAYSFGREALQECKIAGYRVPAGTTLFIFPWVLHRDARWYDDPLAFRPERWADGFEDRLPRYAYLPFGSGPRLCIGRGFAMIEAVLIVAAIARRFRIEWAAEPPRPFTSITLRPTGGLRAQIRAR